MVEVDGQPLAQGALTRAQQNHGSLSAKSRHSTQVMAASRRTRQPTAAAAIALTGLKQWQWLNEDKP